MFTVPTCKMSQHGQIAFTYSVPQFLHLHVVGNNSFILEVFKMNYKYVYISLNNALFWLLFSWDWVSL